MPDTSITPLGSAMIGKTTDHYTLEDVQRYQAPIRVSKMDPRTVFITYCEFHGIALTPTALEYAQSLSDQPLSGEKLVSHEDRVKVLRLLEKSKGVVDDVTSIRAILKSQASGYNALSIDLSYFDHSRRQEHERLAGLSSGSAKVRPEYDDDADDEADDEMDDGADVQANGIEKEKQKSLGGEEWVLLEAEEEGEEDDVEVTAD